VWIGAASPVKTKIVYCKDDDRTGKHEHEKFDFLGYTFRARKSRTRTGRKFINFSPAVSDKALKKMREKMREWNLYDLSIKQIAEKIAPYIRGWFNYYGAYYKSALFSTFNYFNQVLVKVMVRKYKRFKGSKRKLRLVEMIRVCVGVVKNIKNVAYNRCVATNIGCTCSPTLAQA